MDVLLMDAMIIKEATVRQKNLSVAWIDYRKAYNRVPQSWVEEMFEAIKRSDAAS